MLTASVLTIPSYRLLCNIVAEGIISDDVAKGLCAEAVHGISYVVDVVQEAFESHKCSDYASVSAQYRLCVSDVFDTTNLAQCIHISESVDTIVVNTPEYIYTIYFIARVSNLTLPEFNYLQSSISTVVGDSSMASFRVYNPTGTRVTCVSMYYMSPAYAAAYISKVQCLRFETLCICSLETVELPVPFYVSDSLPRHLNSAVLSHVLFLQ